MLMKTKLTLVAAFVLGTASAALAQSNEQFESSQYLRNPNAPVATYQHQGRQMVIEGRNVAVQAQPWADHEQNLSNRSIYLAY
ncbi:MAG: hypothetical protein WD207_11660 [Xanthobacteraceae bacterium]